MPFREAEVSGKADASGIPETTSFGPLYSETISPRRHLGIDKPTGVILRSSRRAHGGAERFDSASEKGSRLCWFSVGCLPRWLFWR